jgi:predicted Zn-dependent protease
LSDRAESLVAAKRFREATDAYRLILRHAPTDGATRLKLANTLWQAQEWNEGALEAIRAADLLPRDRNVQLLAATRALTLLRFADAAARSSALLRDDPDNVQALLVLGNATAKLSDSISAVDFLRTRVRNKRTLAIALGDVRPFTSSTDDASAERAFRHALALAPRAFETRAALVNFLWAAGRLDEAATPLRELADEFPEHPVLNHALASYYVSRGRERESERLFQRLAGIGDRGVKIELADLYAAAGRDAEALAVLATLTGEDAVGSVALRRAAIECRAGQRRPALDRLAHIIARSPSDARALEIKAECLLDTQPSEAVTVARKAVALAPASAQAHFVLGEALIRSGGGDEAFNELTAAVRLEPLHKQAARALARQALESGRPEVAAALSRDLVANASDEEGAVLLVKALLHQRDIRGAEAALRTLLVRFPMSAGLWAAQGDLDVARGATGARQAYERALTIDPDSIDALAGLVALELSHKRTAAARGRIEKARARHPERAVYLRLLAGVCRAEGDTVRSEAMYRELLASDGGDVRAAMGLGELLAATGRTDEARAVLEQLLGRRPAIHEARITLGELLESAGRGAEAERHYRQVLNDNPRAGVPAYRLALLEAQKGGNLDGALDLAVTALQALPTDPHANAAIGWIQVRRNLPRIGLPYLQTSVRGAPEDPTFRYYLGMAYVALGRPHEGRAELARALALSPVFRFAPEARAALSATHE